MVVMPGRRRSGGDFRGATDPAGGARGRHLGRRRAPACRPNCLKFAPRLGAHAVLMMPFNRQQMLSAMDVGLRFGVREHGATRPACSGGERVLQFVLHAGRTAVRICVYDSRAAAAGFGRAEARRRAKGLCGPAGGFGIVRGIIPMTLPLAPAPSRSNNRHVLLTRLATGRIGVVFYDGF